MLIWNDQRQPTERRGSLPWCMVTMLEPTSVFHPDVPLYKADGVLLQFLTFVDPEGALLPVVGFFPEEALSFIVVNQVESMNESNPNDHVDPEVLDEHKMVSKVSVADLQRDEVPSMGLEMSSVCSFEHASLAVQ